ncbi:MFS transporter [Photobacterium galatheae]|uniref:Major facilitator transporter n=1 Tax=Photobacterium galatheae TaxID=1654360 RepID=A0A066RIT3_9GAMM|nr:MFS transporter [Photobacterium galatheae]KDM90209.1 major facilitator transporter [Photobacterium galatheae]MCM0151193.1 MFS transporter [Photobacterium galatheae]
MPAFNWKPLLFACLIVSIGQLGLGLVFPLLPWIGNDLALTSDQTQLLIAVYLLGFGPSQLIYGPLSDVLGRRLVLLAGVLLALFGVAVVIFLADSFNGLLAGRFIQGCGAGSVSVLARAMIRDSYQKQNLAKALTWLAIVAAFTPIMAPVIGGMVNHYLGWLSAFFLLFGYITLIWILLLVSFRETLNSARQPPSVKRLVVSYVSLFRERHFITFAGIGWINFAVVILAISMMPYIMQVQIGMTSEQYAIWAMIPACGFLCGGLLCQRLRPYLGTARMLQLAPLMQILSAAVYIFAPLDPLWMSLAHFLLAVTNGIAFPCAQSMLLTPYSDKSGTVSALSGACQMMVASLVSHVLLQLGMSQSWYLGTVLLGASFLGIVLVNLGIRSESGRQASAELSQP